MPPEVELVFYRIAAAALFVAFALVLHRSFR
jgi:hypothetical protein